MPIETRISAVNPSPVGLPLDLARLLFPTLWIGLLVGVCFIATPAKFQAGSLSLPVALDVGRATFAIWNSVERVLLALMVPLLISSHDRSRFVFMVAGIGALLLLQSLVLLPTLNARIATIIAGGRVESSPDHLAYIAIDTLKIGLLATIVLKTASRFAPILQHFS